MVVRTSLVLVLLVAATIDCLKISKIPRIERSDLDPSVYMHGDLSLLVRFDKEPDVDSPLHEVMNGARPDFDLFVIGQRIFDCAKDPEFRLCNFAGRQRLLFWTQTSPSGIEIALNRAETRQSLFTHCLMIHMSEQVFGFKNRKEMNALLTKAEEEQKVTMLIYVDRYGNNEHKAFMSVAVTVMKVAILAYTNNSDMTLPDRKSLVNKTAHLVAVQPAVDADSSAVFSYKWKFNEVELNKYVHIHTLPLFYHLSDLDGGLPYDDFGLHVAYMLLMPGQYDDEMPMIEFLARKHRDGFGFVIVNMKRFAKHYKRFGLDEPKRYPVLSIAIYGEQNRFEFIDDPNSFNEDVLDSFLNSTKFLYDEARDEKYVTVVKPENYHDVVYKTPKDVLVIFCHDYLEQCDGNFQARVRRLARGIYFSSYVDQLLVVYVPLQKFDIKTFEEDIDENSIPDVRFRRKNSQEFSGVQPLKSGARKKLKLKNLLKFIAQFGYTDVPVMKKRGSDEIPLAGFADLDFEAMGLNKEDIRNQLGMSSESFEDLIQGTTKEPEEMSHALERLTHEMEEEEKEKGTKKKDEEERKEKEKSEDEKKDVKTEAQIEKEVREEVAAIKEKAKATTEKIKEQRAEREALKKRDTKEEKEPPKSDWNEKEALREIDEAVDALEERRGEQSTDAAKWSEKEEDEAEEDAREDDELAAGVFVMENKYKIRWKNRAPALSEESFNATRSQCDVMPVLFLSPWSARAKASILIYNEVVGVFENATEKQLVKKICLRHVDCVAYPTVCDWFRVHSYPTVKIFKKNSIMNYRDMMEVESLVRAIELSQYETVFELSSQGDLLRFVQNDYNDVLLRPEFTLLGLFKEKTRREYEVFKRLAEDEYTRNVFGVCFGDLAAKHAAELHVELPAVIARRHGDNALVSSTETAFTFDGSMSLKDFYFRAQIPVGELTPQKFPVFRSVGLPIVIAFVTPKHAYMSVDELEKDPDVQIEPQDHVFLRTLYRLGKEKKFTDRLILSWMNADKYGFVLASYSLESSVPALAIVDFKSGNVYTLLKPGVLRYSHLRSWVEDYLNGNIQPTSQLKEKEWKPVAKPIDFIAKEAEREEMKRQEREQEKKMGHQPRIGRLPTAKAPRFVGTAPPSENDPVPPKRASENRGHKHEHFHHEL